MIFGRKQRVPKLRTKGVLLFKIGWPGTMSLRRWHLRMKRSQGCKSLGLEHWGVAEQQVQSTEVESSFFQASLRRPVWFSLWVRVWSGMWPERYTEIQPQKPCGPWWGLWKTLSWVSTWAVSCSTAHCSYSVNNSRETGNPVRKVCVQVRVVVLGPEW